MRVLVPKRPNTTTPTIPPNNNNANNGNNNGASSSNSNNNNNNANSNSQPPSPAIEQPPSPITPSPSIASSSSTQQTSSPIRTTPNNNNSNTTQPSIPSSSAVVRPKKKSRASSQPLTINSSTTNNGSNSSNEEGYNSEDEYGGGEQKQTQTHSSSNSHNLIYAIQDERSFEARLKQSKGFIIKKMKEDGNCLFRSIADQVYGDPEMHDVTRTRCMAYMEAERDHFSAFITEDFDSYLQRKRQDMVYGNHLEIQAMAEMFNRPVEVYCGNSTEPINIFQEGYSTDNPPIRLSYHQGNHYNSVLDPMNPTVGVGLGLPAYEPGLADKMQMKAALDASVEEEISKQIFQNSDWEATEQELEEAVLAASRAEWLASLLGAIQVPPEIINDLNSAGPSSSSSTTTTTSTSSPQRRP
eukprot:TRINITY_DN6409_c0_g1_i1.p1 TRINITY_DN6409_c0_g1~~TRINITY_DN6409_c0_g1_i1.p1  ORF type:complete len:412 (-),score=126.56 TRINITY_DN6409_c0_g1_i1:111-1346(-)